MGSGNISSFIMIRLHAIWTNAGIFQASEKFGLKYDDIL